MAVRNRKPVCVGLDVHRNNVWACVTFKDPAKGKDGLVFVTKKFDSNHSDLASMCEWIYTTLPDLEDRAIDVYMESTGKYSTPVFDVCEEMGLKPHIVNPKHVRTIAGQKTDQKDCAWIAELGANGLLRESYIPVRELRESRRLSRSRTKLVQERGDTIRRIRNILTEANIRMDLVFSGIEGESARSVIEYLLTTEEPDLEEVKKRIRKSCRIMRFSTHKERKEKEEELRKAFAGAKFSSVQKFELENAYERVDRLTAQIQRYEQMMTEILEPFKSYLDLLDSIPGISGLSAMQILSETGTDMGQFKNEKHFISWCGLCPQSNQSNNKHKSVKIGKGGYYLKPVLIQCALNAVKHPYFKGKYEAIAARRGKKRALIAIARKMMVLAYHMFQTGEYFQERKKQIPAVLEKEQSEREQSMETSAEATDAPAIIRTAKEIVEMLQNTDDEMKHKIEQLLAQIGIAQCEYQTGAISTI